MSRIRTTPGKRYGPRCVRHAHPGRAAAPRVGLPGESHSYRRIWTRGRHGCRVRFPGNANRRVVGQRCWESGGRGTTGRRGLDGHVRSRCLPVHAAPRQDSGTGPVPASGNARRLSLASSSQLAPGIAMKSLVPPLRVYGHSGSSVKERYASGECVVNPSSEGLADTAAGYAWRGGQRSNRLAIIRAPRRVERRRQRRAGRRGRPG